MIANPVVVIIGVAISQANVLFSAIDLEELDLVPEGEQEGDGGEKFMKALENLSVHFRRESQGQADNGPAAETSVENTI